MSRRHWFWGGFLLVLSSGLLLGLFAAIREGGQWAAQQVQRTQLLPPQWKPVIRLTLEGGEVAYLAPDVASGIRRQTGHWLAHREGGVRRTMDQELEQTLDPIFDRAMGLVPAFADWYYSLSGEYLRLFHAAAGDLPAYLGERLDELVFAPAGTAAALDAALVQLDGRLAGQLRGTAGELQALLRQLVSHTAVRGESGDLKIQASWDPGEGVARSVEPYLALGATDLGRQGLATGAGVAASAAVFKKLGANTVAKVGGALAAKQSAGVLAILGSKLGLKTALKGGVLAGAGAGAAGGAGLCAGSVVGAPLAPGCALAGGVITGAAAWVLVDKAVLETDELLHRDELERQMREALTDQREELKQTLSRHYRELAGQGFAAIGKGVGALTGED